MTWARWRRDVVSFVVQLGVVGLSLYVGPWYMAVVPSIWLLLWCGGWIYLVRRGERR